MRLVISHILSQFIFAKCNGSLKITERGARYEHSDTITKHTIKCLVQINDTKFRPCQGSFKSVIHNYVPTITTENNYLSTLKPDCEFSNVQCKIVHCRLLAAQCDTRIEFEQTVCHRKQK